MMETEHGNGGHGDQRPSSTAIPDFILKLPVAVMPLATVLPPNQKTTLHAGDFELRQGGKRVSATGEVTLHWLPRPEVRFSGVASVGQPRLGMERALLATHPRGVRGRVHVLGYCREFGVPEDGHSGIVYSGIVDGIAVAGARRPVGAVRFHLVNFPAYNGSPVRFESRESVLAARSRLTLKDSDFDVTIDQVPDCNKRLRDVRREGGFAITHSGEVRTASDKPISFDEAQRVLICLHFFLAFLAGHWVGPVLDSGQARRASVWQTNANWKARPGVSPRSWFPHAAPQDIASLMLRSGSSGVTRYGTGLFGRQCTGTSSPTLNPTPSRLHSCRPSYPWSSLPGL